MTKNGFVVRMECVNCPLKCWYGIGSSPQTIIKGLASMCRVIDKVNSLRIKQYPINSPWDEINIGGDMRNSSDETGIG